MGFSSDEKRWAYLQNLAKLTALKYAPFGTFHLGHWWRGPLLYSLVQFYHPKHILEFGTGRGYGSLCMAQAAMDADIDCTVWTIDQIPPTTPQQWAIDEGEGPQLKELSLQEVWQRHFSPSLTQRIHLLTRDSRTIMSNWVKSGSPRIDFCFIDGGHDYWTAKHDFITALRIANPGCTFLFDDYTERKGYGVKRLLDQETLPRISPDAIEVIDILSRDQTVFGEDVAHKMALLHGEYLSTSPINQFYSPCKIRSFEWCYGLVSTIRTAEAFISRSVTMG